MRSNPPLSQSLRTGRRHHFRRWIGALAVGLAPTFSFPAVAAQDEIGFVVDDVEFLVTMGAEASASAINEQGQIAGWAEDPATGLDRAVIWTGTGLLDLNVGR